MDVPGSYLVEADEEEQPGYVCGSSEEDFLFKTDKRNGLKVNYKRKNSHQIFHQFASMCYWFLFLQLHFHRFVDENCLPEFVMYKCSMLVCGSSL